MSRLKPQLPCYCHRRFHRVVMSTCQDPALLRKPWSRSSRSWWSRWLKSYNNNKRRVLIIIKRKKSSELTVVRCALLTHSVTIFSKFNFGWWENALSSGHRLQTIQTKVLVHCTHYRWPAQHRSPLSSNTMALNGSRGSKHHNQHHTWQQRHINQQCRRVNWLPRHHYITTPLNERNLRRRHVSSIQLQYVLLSYFWLHSLLITINVLITVCDCHITTQRRTQNDKWQATSDRNGPNTIVDERKGARRIC